MKKTTNIPSIPYTSTSLAIKGYADSKLAQSERGDCVVRAIAYHRLPIERKADA